MCGVAGNDFQVAAILKLIAERVEGGEGLAVLLGDEKL